MRSPALLLLGLLRSSRPAAAAAARSASRTPISSKQGNAICVAAAGRDRRRSAIPASLADIARIGKQLADIRDDETSEARRALVAKDDEDAQKRPRQRAEAWDTALRDVVAAAQKSDQAGATKALAAGQALGDKAANRRARHRPAGLRRRRLTRAGLRREALDHPAVAVSAVAQAVVQPVRPPLPELDRDGRTR